MRGVLHAEVFGFNFSADINPYQRSDDCVIAAGQITERPRRLSKTSADAPETERGTQVGGTHEHTSMCLSSSEMWLTRSIARNHVQSPVFFLKGVYEGRSLYCIICMFVICRGIRLSVSFVVVFVGLYVGHCDFFTRPRLT